MKLASQPIKLQKKDIKLQKKNKNQKKKKKKQKQKQKQKTKNKTKRCCEAQKATYGTYQHNPFSLKCNIWILGNFLFYSCVVYVKFQ